MLGRLAKWLRILGYDTKFAKTLTDAEILSVAESEGRILLTRDVSLTRRKRCPSHIFVRSDHWREQLKQVYKQARLNRDAILTVCPVCNCRLRLVARESVRSSIPQYVYETQETFSRCDNCARVFWAATHVSEILNELDNLTKES